MDVNIVISLELLMLLDWLTTRENVMLENMVSHALQNGFSSVLNKKINVKDPEMLEEFYPKILDFLLNLENILIDSLANERTRTLNKEEILPVLRKINLKDINPETIYLSSTQASKKLKNLNNPENAKKLLFERILKNWKPNKEDLAN